MQLADARPDLPAGYDQRAVAGLDTVYQAAVKKNDAATMDRILADDFVLVVGSGKTYTKADLLSEARSGHYNYEHGRHATDRSRVGRNSGGDSKVVGERDRERKAFRLHAVVQRYVRANVVRMAIRVWPSIVAAA